MLDGVILHEPEPAPSLRRRSSPASREAIQTRCRGSLPLSEGCDAVVGGISSCRVYEPDSSGIMYQKHQTVLAMRGTAFIGVWFVRSNC